MFNLLNTLMLLMPLTLVGARCDSDLSCAKYTIKICEETQEPADCQFDRLPDEAIIQACDKWSTKHEGREALACSVYYDNNKKMKTIEAEE